MGEKDIAEKVLLSYNDVFSDIVNVLLFGGKEVILENDLEDQTTRTAYKADGKLHEIDRDVAKRWKCGNLRLACIGVENQTSSDPDMPLRVIAYDGMEYRAQLLGKESVRDNRYPVITIVLYFGHRTPWTDSISLKDRLNIPDGFDDYVNDYKSKGYHVWPLITNRFDPGFTSGILADQSVWKKYAHNLVQYAYIYGFDGYNFDFENIDYADRDRLTAFVAYLSNHLHQYNIKTSIDVTGYSDSPEWSLVYNRSAFANSVDYVVLMAYDETWAKSTTAGPVASYPWVRNHTEKMLSEVPSQKLVLGVPFYMRLWHDTNGYAKGETLAMKNTGSYFANYKDKMTWDDRLKLYYLSIPTGSGSDRIWFEDNTSLGLKLDLVKELQLGGFAAWRKGFEDESTIAMIQGKDLGRGIPKSPTAVIPEPVVEETKPLTKLEQYKLRLEEKEKAKAAKAEAKRKAKEEKELAKRKAKEEAQQAKAEKKRLEEEAKAQKERDAQEVKDKIASYKSHGSVQNTTTKNELTKSVQVVKR